MLVKHYPLYSYEALPYTKILNLFGLDVYVFNLKRPPKIISYLAESPYLIKGIFCFIVTGILLIVAFLTNVKRGNIQ